MPEHTLYMNAASAPCRAVLLHQHLVRDAFGPLECVHADLGTQEYAPDFLRSNPLHTVPTLVTPWGSLWESRAIMRYIESMLPEPRLYPSGVYARAVVDRLLDWDLGTLYLAVSSIVYPMVFGRIEPSNQQFDKLSAAVRFLDSDQLGDGRPYLCGPDITIADISITMTLSLLRLVGLEEIDGVPHLDAWQKNLTELDGYADIDAPFQLWVNTIRARALVEHDVAVHAMDHIELSLVVRDDVERLLANGRDLTASVTDANSTAGADEPVGAYDPVDDVEPLEPVDDVGAISDGLDKLMKLKRELLVDVKDEGAPAP